MFQTGYKGISNLVTSKYFYSGFCKLWFTPIENILVWPAVDPLTQFLSEEPTLKEGKTWYGPAKLPDKQLSLAEKLTQSPAGPYYKQQLQCYQPGDDGYTRINAANLAYSEFVFIGLARAGGYFLVFGNDRNGLTLTESEFDNSGTAAGRKMAFSLDSIDPAQPLLSFSGAADVFPPGWPIIEDGGGSGSAVEPLIIPFTDETEITIPWTDDLRDLYGSFPLIQVWKNTPGTPKIFTAAIGVDAPPPDQTVFTVYTPGTPGFIVIK